MMVNVQLPPDQQAAVPHVQHALSAFLFEAHVAVG